jgi:hypothetical protein
MYQGAQKEAWRSWPWENVPGAADYETPFAYFDSLSPARSIIGPLGGEAAYRRWYKQNRFDQSELHSRLWDLHEARHREMAATGVVAYRSAAPETLRRRSERFQVSWDPPGTIKHAKYLPEADGVFYVCFCASVACPYSC